jgi:ubiquinone/menaquinone biosynthesis C-methylase UbiE
VSDHLPPICDYESSDYQQRFWDSGERLYEDRVEAIALRRLMPAQGRRLLEVGAGAGRNTPRYRGFQQIVLLDYSRTQLQQARTRLGPSERYLFVAANVYRLPFVPAAFDAATMIRTLHHMADAPAALAQVRDVLCAGATFILEYANKRNLKAIGRWLLRRQEWNPFLPQPVEFAPLNFDFHPATVRLWLRQTGFRIGTQLTVSHFRLPFLKQHLPAALLASLDAALQWTGVLFQFTPSVFLRAHVQGSLPQSLPQLIWRCPACRSHELEEVNSTHRCHECGRCWPIRDGIYDFKEPLA